MFKRELLYSIAHVMTRFTTDIRVDEFEKIVEGPELKVSFSENPSEEEIYIEMNHYTPKAVTEFLEMITNEILLQNDNLVDVSLEDCSEEDVFGQEGGRRHFNYNLKFFRSKQTESLSAPVC